MASRGNHLFRSFRGFSNNFGRHHDQGSIEKDEHAHLENLGEMVEEFEARHECFSRYPNNWAKIRHRLREAAAELFGTMVLILFGDGVDCQMTLGFNPDMSPTPKGDYLSLNFGWAWFGAMLVFADYFHAKDVFEGEKGRRPTPGTASLFATYSMSSIELPYLPSANCFFDEFVGAFIVILVVFAVTDKRNNPPAPGMVPVALFILIFGTGAAFSMQTGYAVNPARGLGLRIMTAMMGYGRAAFNFRSQYWIWCPILGSFSGALVGAAVYDALLFLGSESWMNRPNAAARRHFVHARTAERQRPPVGFSQDDNAV